MYNIDEKEKERLMKALKTEAKSNRSKLSRTGQNSTIFDATTMLYSYIGAIEAQKTNELLRELIDTIKGKPDTDEDADLLKKALG
jgi:hypothetical protein